MYLICDFDGTLLDSAQIVTAAMDTALKTELGVTLAQSELLSFLGPPLTQTLGAYARAHGIPQEQLISTYRAVYLLREAELRLFPQAEEFLRWAQDNGHHLALATSKPAAVTERILANLDLQSAFEFIAAAPGDVDHTKGPLVAAVLEYWQHPNPNEVFMIGDRIFDIEGAAEHDIRTILVTWGASTQPDEVAAAWNHVDNAAALINLLNEQEQKLLGHISASPTCQSKEQSRCK